MGSADRRRAEGLGTLSCLLLDTHAVIWAFNQVERLGTRARAAMETAEQVVLVSAVSAYEIAYKHRNGKLDEAGLLLDRFAVRLADQQFGMLPLSTEHALTAGKLDWAHKDPFDRLLVAQALVDDLTLVSNERAFDVTGVTRLW